MPMYVYECGACDHQWEEQRPIADRRVPCDEPCPCCATSEISLSPAAPGIGDSYRLGRKNLPSTWTDTLHRIKSKHVRSSINVSGGKREV